MYVKDVIRRARLAGVAALACLTVAGCSAPSHDSADPAVASTSRVTLRCVASDSAGKGCSLWGPSLIELIARPELYDGKRVRVIGFANFEFEGNGLYVSESDWRHGIYRNGVWIDPPAGTGQDSASAPGPVNQRYVIVEATFHQQQSGHMGMWSGSLSDVSRLEPWGQTPAPDASAFKHP